MGQELPCRLLPEGAPGRAPRCVTTTCPGPALPSPPARFGMLRHLPCPCRGHKPRTGLLGWSCFHPLGPFKAPEWQTGPRSSRLVLAKPLIAARANELLSTQCVLTSPWGKLIQDTLMDLCDLLNPLQHLTYQRNELSSPSSCQRPRGVRGSHGHGVLLRNLLPTAHPQLFPRTPPDGSAKLTVPGLAAAQGGDRESQRGTCHSAGREQTAAQRQVCP